MANRRIPAEASIAALLCIACGIADAIGYVNAGVFAANMTGNTVLTGMSIAKGNYVAALETASTFLTFFGGAMIGRLLLHIARSPWLPLLTEGLVLVASAAIDPAQPLVVSLIAFAMGIQATAITRFGGKTLSTVVVTSTLARLAEATSDFFARHMLPGSVGKDGGASLLALTWLAYALGAILAVLFAKLVSAPLLVSAGIILLVSWATRTQMLPQTG